MALFSRYALDDIGSGSHVHISLSRNGENIFMASDGSSRYGMSKIGEAFMAGVLNHLPSILPFTAPLPNRSETFYNFECLAFFTSIGDWFMLFLEGYSVIKI